CFTFLFSSRRRHTRSTRDWSSDVCSSDLCGPGQKKHAREPEENKKTRKQLRHANPGIRLRHAARSSQRPSLALCRLADEKETDGPQQNGDEHQNEIPHVRLLEETSSLGLGAL